MFFGKKKAKKKAEENIVSQNVMVRIYRDIGGSVPHLSAEFKAIERKDNFGGMHIIDENLNFREEVEYEKEEVFNELEVILKISELNRAEAVNKIEEKLKAQKRRVNYLEKFIELNALFNYPDEKQHLSNLRVLYNHIKNINEGKGAFFTVENNMRVYSFVRKNGRYYPIWHGVEDFTTYPSYVNKKKIYNEEQEIFNKEWGELFRRNIDSVSILFLAIVFGVLIIASGFGLFEIYKKSNNLDQQAQAGALQCAEQYNRITEQMGKLLEIDVINRAIQNSQTPNMFQNVNNTVKDLAIT